MVKRNGFTIVELLTVISVITLLTAMTVPCLRMARRQGRRLVNIRNQREIVRALTLFACEHDNSFPTSVAHCVTRDGFRWQEPRKMKTTEPLPRVEHNSVAGYLGEYIDKPDTFFCPNPPARHTYWEEAWLLGDGWDDPQTHASEDALFGTYCLYWNYTAYLKDFTQPFKGPADLYASPKRSDLLVSDYLGYNDWRNLGCFGSCEVLSTEHKQVLTGAEMHSSYWSFSRGDAGQDLYALRGKLCAAFVDGHVETYTPEQTHPIEVSENLEGTIPYGPTDIRYPGIYYLPDNAIKPQWQQVRRGRR